MAWIPPKLRQIFCGKLKGVFERYTEKARRVIFFARYEASQFGTPNIETEHLLLGLMREDKRLREELRKGPASDESFRAQVAAETPARNKIATSVDLPLSHECRRALAYAAEEMEKLNQKFIGTGHLVLGLLRTENSRAATFLKQSGIRPNLYREVVRRMTADEEVQTPEPLLAQEPPPSHPPKAASLAEAIVVLDRLLGQSIRDLDPEQRLKRKPWSRKEAIGHLVDLAITHQRWLARALTEPNVAASGYPEDDWVTAQQYAGYSWPGLVDLWVALNWLLIHVLSAVPEEKLKLECRIGVEAPQTLLALIERYVSAT
jgi:hypothetical protein